MSEKTYYNECGKGDHRRVEDRKAIESNWDKIDWAKKSDTQKQEEDKDESLS